jgi:hypothetical protein
MLCYESEDAMPISLTIEVPDTLGQQLNMIHDRLPEILERGLRDLQIEQVRAYQDEEEIIAVLASRPSPEQILALQPSPAMQMRVSELLACNQQGTLTPEQSAELERYALLEHLVRMAKAYAYRQQTIQP